MVAGGPHEYEFSLTVPKSRAITGTWRRDNLSGTFTGLAPAVERVAA
jgi:hypothetical protein